MTKWTYKVSSLEILREGGHTNFERIEESLNAWASEGWEVISSVPHTKFYNARAVGFGPREVMFILRKPDA